MNMTLEQNKIELIQWLTTIDDEYVINKLNDFRKEITYNWDDLSDEEKASIEAGLKDAEEGNMVDHEEFWKKYEKHL